MHIYIYIYIYIYTHMYWCSQGWLLTLLRLVRYGGKCPDDAAERERERERGKR